MILVTLDKENGTPLKPDLVYKIEIHSFRLLTQQELDHNNRLTQAHKEARTKTHGHLLLRRANGELHRGGSIETRHTES